jgi:LacI family transcriptional regulator
MNSRKQSLTLEEIARLSGVSRSTVSRIINNDPHVDPKTAEKVQVVIHKLNYRPNAAARSLKVGRTHILGLVIPTGVSSVFSDPYFPTLIRGISAACQEKNYSVMLWLAEPEYERATINQVLGNGLIDGVIVSSMPMDDALIQALINSGLPFVLVGEVPAHPEVNFVDVENQRGAYEAVSHFLRLGYRRIATITGPLNTIVGRDRKEGYLSALRSRNVPVDPAMIAEGNFSEEDGYILTKRLLTHNLQAIFAASDAMAMGALRALRESGLRVPQDVAVIGFDDLPHAARTDPPLTTVRQPIMRTGSTAAQLLIDLVEHPDQSQPNHIILPVDLVLRETCGSI